MTLFKLVTYAFAGGLFHRKAESNKAVQRFVRFRMLGERAGFEFLKLVDDSSERQFWGGECHRRKISPYPGGPWTHVLRRFFLRRVMLWKYRPLANRLNAQRRGDEFAAYFRKPR